MTGQQRSGLEISTTIGTDLADVVLAGELDISTIDGVDRELRRVEAHRCAAVVLDLGALSFIDSIGLALLVRWNRSYRAAATELRLAAVTGQVRWFFEITGMLEYFDIAPGEEGCC